MEKPKPIASNPWLPRVRNVFLTGVLVAIPLAATYLVFKWMFDTLDGIFQPLIVLLLGRELPGVGLVAVVVLVYIVGLIATNVGGKVIIQAMDAIMCRMPVIHWVYQPARQVVDAMRRLKQAPFNRVVLVEFPKADMYALAFVTGKPVEIKGQMRVPVFIPHVPNPMTGFLLLLKPEDLVDTEMTVEDTMRVIVSAGLLATETLGKPSAI